MLWAELWIVGVRRLFTDPDFHQDDNDREWAEVCSGTSYCFEVLNRVQDDGGVGLALVALVIESLDSASQVSYPGPSIRKGAVSSECHRMAW